MSRDAAPFLLQAIQHFHGSDPKSVRLLDFGCGTGGLVDELCAAGVDAWGCDVDPYWKAGNPRLRPIPRTPYRIPFDDDSFDVVISTGVLEHAGNVNELFREIARVLKSGGVAMHIYPAKWYLPTEPHIFVPFVSFMWPNVPRWWLSLWAILGVRNSRQRGMGWREVTALNAEFCVRGLCYFRESVYREAAQREFGNVEMPMDYFLRNSRGGAAKVYRMAASRPFAWLLRHTRTAFLLMRRNE